MVEDDLKITNEIWRKWDEQKIKPPMTWQQLWDKVREYIKAGKDPYDIIFETQLKMLGGEEAKPISLPMMPFRWKCLKCGETFHTWSKVLPKCPKCGSAEVEPTAPTLPPWSNPEPEAVVEERELPTFAEWLLAAVKRVWETKKGEIHWEWLIEPSERGVLVGLRGVSRPHELFTPEVIKEIEGYLGERRTTFTFESERELDTAAKVLSDKYGIWVVKTTTGPPMRYSLTFKENPDYVLETLANEGFDTSKILVERG